MNYTKINAGGRIFEARNWLALTEKKEKRRKGKIMPGDGYETSGGKIDVFVNVIGFTGFHYGSRVTF